MHNASADADMLSIVMALDVVDTCAAYVLVEEYTYLLILLTVLSDPDKYINMLIPGRKCHPYKVYKSAALMSALGGIVDSMLFVHAATGCKTTSAGYLKGKRLPFRKLHAQRNAIAAASEAFLCFVYGGKIDDHLDVKRYQL